MPEYLSDGTATTPTEGSEDEASAARLPPTAAAAAAAHRWHSDGTLSTDMSAVSYTHLTLPTILLV